VAEVADEVGYSRRHLGNLLRAEVGLTPKEYQRVARFEHRRSRLIAAATAGRPSLADVAVRAGYADQAHLTREWVRLAGCTPSTWLAEEFPFVQDRDGDGRPS
jgi:AraC-like DNA-binding protein